MSHSMADLELEKLHPLNLDLQAEKSKNEGGQLKTQSQVKSNREHNKLSMPQNSQNSIDDLIHVARKKWDELQNQQNQYPFQQKKVLDAINRARNINTPNAALSNTDSNFQQNNNNLLNNSNLNLNANQNNPNTINRPNPTNPQPSLSNRKNSINRDSNNKVRMRNRRANREHDAVENDTVVDAQNVNRENRLDRQNLTNENRLENQNTKNENKLAQSHSSLQNLEIKGLSQHTRSLEQAKQAQISPEKPMPNQAKDMKI